MSGQVNGEVVEPSAVPAEVQPGARRWPTLLAVAAAVVLVDQATKTWALRALDDRTIDLVGSLRLNLVFNTGSAFSIGAGLGPVLAIVGVVVVLVLLRASKDLEGRLALIGLGLVLGGAVGNLVDRAFRSGDGFLGGAVVDFVDLQWWPVFNVADAAICVGVVGLAIALGGSGATEASGTSPSGPSTPGSAQR